MKDSFKSAIKDPFIKEMIKAAAVVIAFVLAVIGIKMMKDRFKK